MGASLLPLPAHALCHRRQAFVPSGAAACLPEGCPLFVAVDGTGDEFFDPPDQPTWMIHMVRRGFVGVTMEYQAAFGEFGLCDQTGAGKILQVAGNNDLVQKAGAIFDPTDEGSVVSQLCDGPAALANCDLGIAVQGECSDRSPAVPLRSTRPIAAPCLTVPVLHTTASV